VDNIFDKYVSSQLFTNYYVYECWFMNIQVEYEMGHCAVFLNLFNLWGRLHFLPIKWSISFEFLLIDEFRNEYSPMQVLSIKKSSLVTEVFHMDWKQNRLGICSYIGDIKQFL